MNTGAFFFNFQPLQLKKMSTFTLHWSLSSSSASSSGHAHFQLVSFWKLSFYGCNGVPEQACVEKDWISNLKISQAYLNKSCPSGIWAPKQFSSPRFSSMLHKRMHCEGSFCKMESKGVCAMVPQRPLASVTHQCSLPLECMQGWLSISLCTWHRTETILSYLSIVVRAVFKPYGYTSTDWEWTHFARMGEGFMSARIAVLYPSWVSLFCTCWFGHTEMASYFRSTGEIF